MSSERQKTCYLSNVTLRPPSTSISSCHAAKKEESTRSWCGTVSGIAISSLQIAMARANQVPRPGQIFFASRAARWPPLLPRPFRPLHLFAERVGLCGEVVKAADEVGAVAGRLALPLRHLIVIEFEEVEVRLVCCPGRGRLVVGQGALPGHDLFERDARSVAEHVVQ